MTGAVRNYFLHTNANERNAAVVNYTSTAKHSTYTFHGDVTHYNDTLNQIPHVLQQDGRRGAGVYYTSLNEESSRLPSGVSLSERADDEVMEIEVSVQNPIDMIYQSAELAGRTYAEYHASKHGDDARAYAAYKMPEDDIGIRFPYIDFKVPSYPRDIDDSKLWASEKAMLSFFTHEFREYIYVMFFDNRPVNERKPLRSDVYGFNEAYKSMEVQFRPLNEVEPERFMYVYDNPQHLMGSDPNIRYWRVYYPAVENSLFIKGSVLIRCHKNV